ncbi:hypothetical protein ERO13_A10G075600v2 [Gossypium hirsutum]|uniref:Uncharacterized protein n=4 Tax=Gossypium TaxID=3633 RepID=A0A5J5U0Q6_GOSBA|nr:hypothetical protein ES319_A10G079300v1 [Gossypium barbadense]KAG4178942.1 hypothetical protein ERO13_A10G075600v2 [Gossypium hirsutum]TYG98052.1 hypothetical protein ES288_A10G087200v1 [Gossypium darwinii]TYI05408.1 hypothetical protein ES332_A10G086500v1 [Gossypium tomentosum]TYJ13918.1 hypothetical protein E1A91_A10G082700v1 [Gossypium mustelinum]
MFLQIEKGKKKWRRGRGGDDAHSVSVLADFGVHRRSTPPLLPPPWNQSETPKTQVRGVRGQLWHTARCCGVMHEGVVATHLGFLQLFQFWAT